MSGLDRRAKIAWQSITSTFLPPSFCFQGHVYLRGLRELPRGARALALGCDNGATEHMQQGYAKACAKRSKLVSNKKV